MVIGLSAEELLKGRGSSGALRKLNPPGQLTAWCLLAGAIRI